MKKVNLYNSTVLMLLLTLLSCGEHKENEEYPHDADGNHIVSGTKESGTNKVNSLEIDTEKAEQDSHNDELILTQEQLEILGIKVEALKERTMNGFIQVNGQLRVPPQNEAVVTSIIGANISGIKSIEGDKVSKGQTLAYISHPNIIKMQTDYLQTFNQLIFLEQDYNRQKKLYDAEVGSGRDYQLALSSFSSAKGLAKGYESQLRLLGLSPENVKAGNISQEAPIKSPIDGFIERVLIKSGQYVQPQTSIFEIVNTDHIHVDLMVFEKDASKVKNGQIVKFNIEALGNTDLTAKIYSVGKSFEEGPKALHVHAKIENKDKNLIPGMYVNARIITDENLEKSLTEDAVFQEGEKFYVFIAEKEEDGNWGFMPKEIIVKYTSNGYVAFNFIDKIDTSTLVAQSGAYYLMAELKKSEAEHSH